MDLAVGEELCAHIIQVVALLQVAEIGPELGIADEGQLLGLAIQLVEGILLQFVAEPRAEVPLFVGPGNGIRHAEGSHGLDVLRRLGGGHELHPAVREHLRGQGAHEIEYAALGLLVLAEGLVVHKQVHDISVRLLEPSGELLGRQGPLGPAALGEAEGQVVAELVVAEKELQAGLGLGSVDIIRTLPAHNVAGAFREHSLESEVIDLAGDGVGIDELGVAEGHGSDAEVFLDGLLVLLHLVDELGGGGQGGKRVVVGLAEELHLAGGRKLTEAVQHLGGVAVELLERRAGDRKSHLELALALGDGLEKQFIHRQIALLRHSLEDGAVGVVVVVVGVLSYIEEPVLTEPCGLMDLEI